MSNELTTVIVSLLSVILGSIISYFSTMKKNAAEIEHLKAEAEKSRTETQKIKMEIQESKRLIQQAKNGDLNKEMYEREIRKLTEENSSLKSRIENLTQESMSPKNQQKSPGVPPPPNSPNSAVAAGFY